MYTILGVLLLIECHFIINHIESIIWCADYEASYVFSRFMMTSSNGNIFRVNGPLCGEFTGHRWIPLTKASDAELWCFLWYAPEQ